MVFGDKVGDKVDDKVDDGVFGVVVVVGGRVVLEVTFSLVEAKIEVAIVGGWLDVVDAVGVVVVVKVVSSGGDTVGWSGCTSSFLMIAKSDR